jgi:6-phosphogluconolactonase
VPDLGTDEVVIYRLDAAEHSLHRHRAGKVLPGSGPRHLKFHPNGRWVYVLNELGLTVTGFEYNSDVGSLERFQTVVALPEVEVKIPSSGSEIRMHPNGKFVYAGLRGHDVIAVFQINQQTGVLSLIDREPIRGSCPRNFGIDPTGKWLLAAGAESSTVSVFEIDPNTGRLKFARQVIHVPQSICVEFLLH